MTPVLVKLALRVLVFGLVFALAVKKHERIKLEPRWALPLVGLVFALLNTGLYWLLRPVLNLATLGAAALVVPLAVNGAFLWATQKAVARARVKLTIEGLRPAIFLAVLLTVAHGVLYLALDVLWK